MSYGLLVAKTGHIGRGLAKLVSRNWPLGRESQRIRHGGHTGTCGGWAFRPFQKQEGGPFFRYGRVTVSLIPSTTAATQLRVRLQAFRSCFCFQNSYCTRFYIMPSTVDEENTKRELHLLIDVDRCAAIQTVSLQKNGRRKNKFGSWLTCKKCFCKM